MERKELVVGIDLGSADSYVGYISKAGLDIVQNEVSQRKTPTLVGFTERERLLGDTAYSQIKSNVKNTCRNFKHLLGQKFDSPGVEAERFWSTCPLVEAADGLAGFSVMYKGAPRTFSTVEISAMFLTKLREITEAWSGGNVSEVVIGVPSYFSDRSRTALLDAANVAGLNVLRLMNEHTATALAYGYFRSNDFDAEKPMTVVFCSMGHVIFSVAVVQFVRGKLTVVCEKSDKVGGRDMDECLMRTFAKQFEKKVGVDPLSNKRASFKLEDAVMKTKKVLSANSTSTINCECLMEDEDFAGQIDRDDFLQMCEPMMKKVSDVLEAAKAEMSRNGVPACAIDAVELCGGSLRVPWVKEMCSKAFGGKELSTTMNADESVARGCALQAAMLSPLYKVKEFKVEDKTPFPVSLSWLSAIPSPAKSPNGAGADDANGQSNEVASRKSVVVFKERSPIHLLKVMTFMRQGPFELKASYADENVLPPGTAAELGAFMVELPPQSEPKKVKVRAALTLHGTFELQGAQLVEEAKEEGVPAIETSAKDGAVNSASDTPAVPPASPATNGKDNGEDGGDRKRPAEGQQLPAGAKKRFKRTDLSIVASGRLGLGEAELKVCREAEEAMRAETLEIIATNARRNDLEAYILGMRGNLAEKYAQYILSADREKLTGQLQNAEDWLYDNLDAQGQVYVDKLAELRLLGDPAEARYREASRRPELLENLEGLVAKCRGRAAEVGHVQAAKSHAMGEVCTLTERWLSDTKAKQATVSLHENPVLTCADLETKCGVLSGLFAALKPPAEVPPARTVSEDGGGGANAASSPWGQLESSPGNEIEVD